MERSGSSHWTKQTENHHRLFDSDELVEIYGLSKSALQTLKNQQYKERVDGSRENQQVFSSTERHNPHNFSHSRSSSSSGDVLVSYPGTSGMNYKEFIGDRKSFVDRDLILAENDKFRDADCQKDAELMYRKSASDADIWSLLPHRLDSPSAEDDFLRNERSVVKRNPAITESDISKNKYDLIGAKLQQRQMEMEDFYNTQKQQLDSSSSMTRQNFTSDRKSTGDKVIKVTEIENTTSIWENYFKVKSQKNMDGNMHGNPEAKSDLLDNIVKSVGLDPSISKLIHAKVADLQKTNEEEKDSVSNWTQRSFLKSGLPELDVPLQNFLKTKSHINSSSFGIVHPSKNIDHLADQSPSFVDSKVKCMAESQKETLVSYDNSDDSDLGNERNQKRQYYIQHSVDSDLGNRERQYVAKHSFDSDLVNERNRERQYVTKHSVDSDLGNERNRERQYVTKHSFDSDLENERNRERQYVTKHSFDSDLGNERNRERQYVTKHSVDSDLGNERNRERQYVTKRSVDSDLGNERNRERQYVTKHSVDSDLGNERNRERQYVTKHSVDSDLGNERNLERQYVTRHSFDSDLGTERNRERPYVTKHSFDSDLGNVRNRERQYVTEHSIDSDLGNERNRERQYVTKHSFDSDLGNERNKESQYVTKHLIDSDLGNERNREKRYVTQYPLGVGSSHSQSIDANWNHLMFPRTSSPGNLRSHSIDKSTYEKYFASHFSDEDSTETHAERNLNYSERLSPYRHYSRSRSRNRYCSRSPYRERLSRKRKHSRSHSRERFSYQQFRSRSRSRERHYSKSPLREHHSRKSRREQFYVNRHRSRSRSIDRFSSRSRSMARPLSRSPDKERHLSSSYLREKFDVHPYRSRSNSIEKDSLGSYRCMSRQESPKHSRNKYSDRGSPYDSYKGRSSVKRKYSTENDNSDDSHIQPLVKTSRKKHFDDSHDLAMISVSSNSPPKNYVNPSHAKENVLIIGESLMDELTDQSLLDMFGFSNLNITILDKGDIPQSMRGLSKFSFDSLYRYRPQIIVLMLGGDDLDTPSYKHKLFLKDLCAVIEKLENIFPNTVLAVSDIERKRKCKSLELNKEQYVHRINVINEMMRKEIQSPNLLFWSRQVSDDCSRESRMCNFYERVRTILKQCCWFLDNIHRNRQYRKKDKPLKAVKKSKSASQDLKDDNYDQVNTQNLSFGSEQLEPTNSAVLPTQTYEALIVAGKFSQYFIESNEYQSGLSLNTQILDHTNGASSIKGLLSKDMHQLLKTNTKIVVILLGDEDLEHEDFSLNAFMHMIQQLVHMLHDVHQVSVIVLCEILARKLTSCISKKGYLRRKKNVNTKLKEEFLHHKYVIYHSHTFTSKIHHLEDISTDSRLFHESIQTALASAIDKIESSILSIAPAKASLEDNLNIDHCVILGSYLEELSAVISTGLEFEIPDINVTIKSNRDSFSSIAKLKESSLNRLLSDRTDLIVLQIGEEDIDVREENFSPSKIVSRLRQIVYKFQNECQIKFIVVCSILPKKYPKKVDALQYLRRRQKVGDLVKNDLSENDTVLFWNHKKISDYYCDVANPRQVVKKLHRSYESAILSALKQASATDTDDTPKAGSFDHLQKIESEFTELSCLPYGDSSDHLQNTESDITELSGVPHGDLEVSKIQVENCTGSSFDFTNDNQNSTKVLAEQTKTDNSNQAVSCEFNSNINHCVIFGSCLQDLSEAVLTGLEFSILHTNVTIGSHHESFSSITKLLKETSFSKLLPDQSDMIVIQIGEEDIDADNFSPTKLLSGFKEMILRFQKECQIKLIMVCSILPKNNPKTVGMEKYLQRKENIACMLKDKFSSDESVLFWEHKRISGYYCDAKNPSWIVKKLHKSYRSGIIKFLKEALANENEEITETAVFSKPQSSANQHSYKKQKLVASSASQHLESNSLPFDGHLDQHSFKVDKSEGDKFMLTDQKIPAVETKINSSFESCSSEINININHCIILGSCLRELHTAVLTVLNFDILDTNVTIESHHDSFSSINKLLKKTSFNKLLPVRPDMIVIQMGEEDIDVENFSPTRLLSDFKKLVFRFQNECQIKFIMVCSILSKKNPKKVTLAEYLQRKQNVADMLKSEFSGNDLVLFWDHKRINDYYCDIKNQHSIVIKLYKSFRFGIIKAVKQALANNTPDTNKIGSSDHLHGVTKLSCVPPSDMQMPQVYRKSDTDFSSTERQKSAVSLSADICNKNVSANNLKWKAVLLGHSVSKYLRNYISDGTLEKNLGMENLQFYIADESQCCKNLHDLNTSSKDWLVKESPDIILLMLGEKDLDSSEFQPETLFRDYCHLIDELIELLHDVTIILFATLPVNKPINVTYKVYRERRLTFNKRLKFHHNSRSVIFFPIEVHSDTLQLHSKIIVFSDIIKNAICKVVASVEKTCQPKMKTFEVVASVEKSPEPKMKTVKLECTKVPSLEIVPEEDSATIKAVIMSHVLAEHLDVDNIIKNIHVDQVKVDVTNTTQCPTNIRDFKDSKINWLFELLPDIIFLMIGEEDIDSTSYNIESLLEDFSDLLNYLTEFLLCVNIVVCEILPKKTPNNVCQKTYNERKTELNHNLAQLCNKTEGISFWTLGKFSQCYIEELKNKKNHLYQSINCALTQARISVMKLKKPNSRLVTEVNPLKQSSVVIANPTGNPQSNIQVRTVEVDSLSMQVQRANSFIVNRTKPDSSSSRQPSTQQKPKVDSHSRMDSVKATSSKTISCDSTKLKAVVVSHVLTKNLPLAFLKKNIVVDNVQVYFSNTKQCPATIEEIKDSQMNWLKSKAPDIILLMIGENDIDSTKYDFNHFLQNLSALINQLRKLIKGVTIFVCEVLPVKTPNVISKITYHDRRTELNKQLDQMLNSKDDISFWKFGNLFQCYIDEFTTKNVIENYLYKNIKCALTKAKNLREKPQNSDLSQVEKVNSSSEADRRTKPASSGNPHPGTPEKTIVVLPSQLESITKAQKSKPSQVERVHSILEADTTKPETSSSRHPNTQKKPKLDSLSKLDSVKVTSSETISCDSTELKAVVVSHVLTKHLPTTSLKNNIVVENVQVYFSDTDQCPATIDEIKDCPMDWLISQAPDIILLIIGENDIDSTKYDLNHFLQNLSELINQLMNLVKDGSIVVCEVLPVKTPKVVSKKTYHERRTELNIQLHQMFKSKDHISFWKFGNLFQCYIDEFTKSVIEKYLYKNIKCALTKAKNLIVKPPNSDLSHTEKENSVTKPDIGKSASSCRQNSGTQDKTNVHSHAKLNSIVKPQNSDLSQVERSNSVTETNSSNPDLSSSPHSDTLEKKVDSHSKLHSIVKQEDTDFSQVEKANSTTEPDSEKSASSSSPNSNAKEEIEIDLNFELDPKVKQNSNLSQAKIVNSTKEPDSEKSASSSSPNSNAKEETEIDLNFELDPKVKQNSNLSQAKIVNSTKEPDSEKSASSSSPNSNAKEETEIDLNFELDPKVKQNSNLSQAKIVNSTKEPDSEKSASSNSPSCSPNSNSKEETKVNLHSELNSVISSPPETASNNPTDIKAVVISHAICKHLEMSILKKNIQVDKVHIIFSDTEQCPANINDLEDSSKDWLMSEAPDIIMLLIGEQDITSSSYNLDDVLKDYSHLVSQIQKLFTNTTVIVCEALPLKNTPELLRKIYISRKREFNLKLSQMFDERDHVLFWKLKNSSRFYVDNLTSGSSYLFKNIICALTEVKDSILQTKCCESVQSENKLPTI